MGLELAGLRRATVADIEGMHKVRMSVNENRLSDPARIGAEDYRALLEGAGRGWVFEIEGAIVGFAIGDHDQRNIWTLFVAPLVWAAGRPMRVAAVPAARPARRSRRFMRRARPASPRP